VRWPSRDNLLLYLGLWLLLDLLFLVVYGASNWFNSNRSEHYSLYSSRELDIPLLPAMIYPYLSVSLIFLLPLFTLNSAQLMVLAKRMAGAIVMAGLIFILLPTQLGFERSSVIGSINPLFALVYLLDHPHNLFPSLHVALSSLVLAMALAAANAWQRGLLIIWWVLLCLSVVFVHQHHLIDIVGGLVLAGLLCRVIPQPPARLPDRVVSRVHRASR
jgi:membrane-associated phospholipid phosphatase